MIRGIRWMSRAVVAAVVIVGAGMIPATPTARIAAPEAPDAGQAVSRIEVRLRKLHLVRPDLIPYPIHYDVYC